MLSMVLPPELLEFASFYVRHSCPNWRRTEGDNASPRFEDIPDILHRRTLPPWGREYAFDLSWDVAFKAGVHITFEQMDSANRHSAMSEYLLENEQRAAFLRYHLPGCA